MKAKIIVVSIVVAMVLATVVIAAGPRGAGMRPGAGQPGRMGMGGQRVAAELGLTQNQVAQVKQLHADFMAATAAQRQQLQEKSRQMAQLWAADQPDAVAIKSLAGEIDAIRADIRNACIDNAVQGLKILTPEQRTKLQTMVRNKAGAMDGWGFGCGCGMCGGMGCGIGCGIGGGMGMGMGCGMGDGTGPRSQMGTCPMAK